MPVRTLIALSLVAAAAFAGSASAELYRCLSVATTPLGTAELLGLTMPFALHLALGRYNVVVRVLCALWIVRRRQGLDGDGLGAGVEVAFAAILLAIAVVP